jgi:hypothetical protein
MIFKTAMLNVLEGQKKNIILAFFYLNALQSVFQREVISAVGLYGTAILNLNRSKMFK